MSSFLTPPRSAGLRVRENATASTSAHHVVWSEKNSIHLLSPSGSSPLAPISLNTEPKRSILKKPSISELPSLDASTREVTPEPSDFKDDSRYLVYPILEILSVQASLSNLIGAYNILAARLRSCFSKDVEPEPSWPLFQPIKDNADALVSCIVRDLGKACEDPLESEDTENARPPLPSPMPSPQKKHGMSEEQARNARDLCTTCQSVIKLLGIMLSERALMDLLTEDHMRDILTAIIAIPLYPQLPTLNSRKTYALSIWLIQTQRLPQDILFPAKDRIAYALRRAIEGELGKEGKKGSTFDGLKAIHELSVYQPETFIPAFAQIFSSILGNLTASSLNIRNQACHALGGFTLGFVSLPRKYFHTVIANELATFIKTRPLAGSPSKSDGPQSPTKNEAPIIRTLRTTLQNIDCSHIAQGPVWASCVLSSFIALLGPLLKQDKDLSRIISALLNLALRHKKGPLRGLTCATWRCISWAYMQHPLPGNPNDDSDSEDEEPLSPGTIKLQETMWRVATSVIDMGAGTSIIAGLLGDDEKDEGHFVKVVEVLRAMVQRSATTYAEALMIIRQLIHPDQNKTREWDINRSLPQGLFSANPGLLTTDAKDMQSLSPVVNALFSDVPDVLDITPLASDEVASLLPELWEIWKECLEAFPRFCDKSALSELVDSWNTLIKTQLRLAEDEDDRQAIVLNATCALMDVLIDHEALWCGKSGSSSSPSKSSPSKSPKVLNAPLKLKVVRELWIQLRIVVASEVPSEELMHSPAKALIVCLMSHERVLAYSTSQARSYWNAICAHVLLDADVPALKAFWGEKIDDDVPRWQWDWPADIRSGVWHKVAEVFAQSEETNYESVLVLLGVPFSVTNSWHFEGSDYDLWESLLKSGLDKALDRGDEAIVYFDSVARSVSEIFDHTFSGSNRIADLLMSYAESHMSDSNGKLPHAMMDLVNDILHAAYPPHPKDITPNLWMIRSLTKLVEICPKGLVNAFLRSVQEGAAQWISDESRTLDEDDNYSDVQSLWETITLRMFELPNDAETIEVFTPLIESIFASGDKRDVSMESFDELWSTLYLHKVDREAWPACVQQRFAQSEYQIMEATVSLEEVVPEEEEAESCPDVSITHVETPSSILLPEAQPEPTTVPISPSQSELLASPPSTPASDHIPLPATPRKMSADLGFPYNIPSRTPPSPTPHRGFGSPRNIGSPATPSRKRKRAELGEDKENDSPSRSTLHPRSPARSLFGSRGSPTVRNSPQSPLRKRKLSMDMEEEAMDEDELSLKPWKKQRAAQNELLPSPQFGSVPTQLSILLDQQPLAEESRPDKVGFSQALIPYAPQEPLVFSFSARLEPADVQTDQTVAESPDEDHGLTLFGSPLKREEEAKPIHKAVSPTPWQQITLPPTPSSESPRKRAKLFVEPPALHEVYPDLYMRSPKKPKDASRSILRRNVTMPNKSTPKMALTPTRRSGRLASTARKNSYKLRENGHPGYGTPKKGTVSVAGQLETPLRSLESDDGPHIQRRRSMRFIKKEEEEEEEEEEEMATISPVKEVVRRRMLRMASA